MKEENFETFKNAILSLKEENKHTVNIIMHDNPDPDTMGSAMGLHMILKYHAIASTIYYRGEISHPQNKTLVNVLALNDFQKIATGINFSDKDSPCITVDCTEKNSCSALIPYMVIDHHKNDSTAIHKIIAPEYGACSTLVFDLWKKIVVPISGEDLDEYKNTFTAMLVGVRTDTNDLTSENMIKEDFIAYQELLDFADTEALQKIMNYPYPRYLYERRMDLSKDGNHAEQNGVFVGGLGFIPSAQRDVISILSEEYSRMESVNTSIIFAIVGKKTLQVSVRSSNVSLDVGDMCRELFGETAGGTGYKGGASIPLTFYSDLENGEKDKFWNVTCKHMFRKVFKEAWVDDHKEEEK